MRELIVSFRSAPCRAPVTRTDGRPDLSDVSVSRGPQRPLPRTGEGNRAPKRSEERGG